MSSLQNTLQVHHYQPGEVIITQGEYGDCLIYIIDGEVEVCRQEEDGRTNCLATLKKGEIAGEMALITGSRRYATLKAVKETKVMVVNDRTFQMALINDDLPIIRDIINQMALRLKKLDQEKMEARQEVETLQEELRLLRKG